MQGKICLVTGASSGIGKYTALGLAKQGAHVVLLCRNQEKADQVRDEIIHFTGNNKISTLVADLSSQAQIRDAVREFKKRHKRLDVLINNAGMFSLERKLSVDNIELTFAVNHLAYFLLTGLLLETLLATPLSRIVNVSSEAHRHTKINFDDIQGAKVYGGWGAYRQSKLANILFSYELARRMPNTNTTVNCLHPGLVATDLWVDHAGPLGPMVNIVLGKLLKPMMRPSERGADTSIYLASATEVAGVTGKYFIDKVPYQSSPESYDQESARKLWDLSMELTKAKK